MDKILTIIIPTYNVERYIDKCLGSLVVNGSLLKQIEVLVIIDGSKDRSCEIAETYHKRFPESFSVICKENGNYGSCINRGLKEASGKYVKILDADDYFDTSVLPSYLETLHNVDSDLFLNDYALVNPEGNTIEKRKFQMLPATVHLVTEIVKPLSEIEMHAITYRRQMLLDMNYSQTEEISYTDTEWAYIPLQNVNTVYYIDKILYKYLVGREGQTMDVNIRKRNFDQMLKVYRRLLLVYTKNNLRHHKIAYLFHKRLHSFFLRSYASAIINKEIPSKQVAEADSMLKEFEPDIYAEMEEISYSRIPYVSIWRKHGYRLPFLIRLKIGLVQFKRKCFPSLKLGRV